MGQFRLDVILVSGWNAARGAFMALPQEDIYRKTLLAGIFERAKAEGSFVPAPRLKMRATSVSVAAGHHASLSLLLSAHFLFALTQQKSAFLLAVLLQPFVSERWRGNTVNVCVCGCHTLPQFFLFVVSCPFCMNCYPQCSNKAAPRTPAGTPDQSDQNPFILPCAYFCTYRFVECTHVSLRVSPGNLLCTSPLFLMQPSPIHTHALKTHE